MKNTQLTKEQIHIIIEESVGFGYSKAMEGVNDYQQKDHLMSIYRRKSSEFYKEAIEHCDTIFLEIGINIPIL